VKKAIPFHYSFRIGEWQGVIDFGPGYPIFGCEGDLEEFKPVGGAWQMNTEELKNRISGLEKRIGRLRGYL